MTWLDEGALYNQISAYLNEDLGRGDITTQSVVVRNALFSWPLRQRADFRVVPRLPNSGISTLGNLTSRINHCSKTFHASQIVVCSRMNVQWLDPI